MECFKNNVVVIVNKTKTVEICLKQQLKRKPKIRPKIISELRPPVVTTARKTLSEKRGLVVTTRFSGIT